MEETILQGYIDDARGAARKFTGYQQECKPTTKQKIQLRPMSEAPKDNRWVWVVDRNGDISPASRVGNGHVWYVYYIQRNLFPHEIKGFLYPEDIEFVLPEGAQSDV